MFVDFCDLRRGESFRPDASGASDQQPSRRHSPPPPCPRHRYRTTITSGVAASLNTPREIYRPAEFLRAHNTRVHVNGVLKYVRFRGIPKPGGKSTSPPPPPHKSSRRPTLPRAQNLILTAAYGIRRRAWGWVLLPATVPGGGWVDGGRLVLVRA